jgi:hypothetical protein
LASPQRACAAPPSHNHELHKRRPSAPQGSDASARSATRALLDATRQLEAVSSLLCSLGVAYPHPQQAAGSANAAAGDSAAAGLGRNTIVRSMLQQMGGGKGDKGGGR